jgi:hypothetical protein
MSKNGKSSSSYDQNFIARKFVAIMVPLLHVFCNNLSQTRLVFDDDEVRQISCGGRNCIIGRRHHVVSIALLGWFFGHFHPGTVLLKPETQPSQKARPIIIINFFEKERAGFPLVFPHFNTLQNQRYITSMLNNIQYRHGDCCLSLYYISP